MPQAKMVPAFTLFPDFVALVPLESIAGDTPAITNFSEITKLNSFVMNDASADTDLTINEDGIQINYTKNGDAVKAFDAGGLGDLDDVTIERSLQINIGVNGFSHDILAILLGLDPATDIVQDMKFLKDDAVGVNATGAKLRGNIRKEKFLFFARVPLDDDAEGDLYLVSPKVVVMDQEINHLMTNQKVKYTIPLKGLKLLNSAQLSTLQGLAEPISNGYELLYWWNAASEAYVP